MKKLFVIAILIITFSVVGQEFKPLVVKSETQILRINNELRDQRNSTIKYQKGKKNKPNELQIKIDRIQRYIMIKHRDMSESDTVNIEGESFLVDTNNPIPQGEEHKEILESLVSFTNNPIVLKENKPGQFESLPVKRGAKNIGMFLNSKLPILHSTYELSSIKLRIPVLNSIVTDTVISEAYQGVFITEYQKKEELIEVKGRFVYLNKNDVIEIPDVVSEIFDTFNYKGIIKPKNDFIESMELEVQTKSLFEIKSIKMKETREDAYRVVVKNSFE